MIWLVYGAEMARKEACWSLLGPRYRRLQGFSDSLYRQLVNRGTPLPWERGLTSYTPGRLLSVFNSLLWAVACRHSCDRISLGKGGYLKEGLLPPMLYNDSQPSYLLVGLIEQSELRELLDKVYLYALQPSPS